MVLRFLSFNDLKELSNYKIINNIIIAIPSLSSEDLKIIINKLSTITMNVSFINSNSFGEKKFLDLSDITEKIMSEIFNRKMNKKLNLIKKINKKNVLITGAGGSIGSELVKQSLICGAKVIALDHSELALYNLEKNLSNQFSKKKLKVFLGSINDLRILEKIKQKEKNRYNFSCCCL